MKTCAGDKDHDAELVTATHMNPHHSETNRRNTRDRLHVEIDVRTTTAKDTTSVMAKLMDATEGPTSDVTDHRRIHATSRGEQCSHFLSWQAECRKQVNDESLQVEGWLHGVDGFDPQTTCRQTTSESTKQLGEPPSESTKPAPMPSVLGGPNEESVDHEPAEIVDDNAASNDAGTETPPIVPGRRTVGLSANPTHEGWRKRHS